MSVTAKLVGFLAVLLLLFGGAVGLGTAVGPVEATAPPEHDDMTDDTDDDTDEDMDTSTGTDATTAATLPKGLMVSQNGYTFRLTETTADPGRQVPVSFTIEGPDGAAVTEYDIEHEKRLHLIAVRRDLSGFQHVHPELASDGTWRSALDLTSGQWRLFADFKATAGEALTLGADLAVAGPYRPAAPAANSRTAAVEGYTVTLDGDLAAGEEAELTLRVSRDGRPVADLEPYLGAFGHLVALRGGDLAYLHVHPEGEPGDGETEPGPEITFFTEVPSPGRYHLYLDFKHQGVVRTAAFTVTVSGGGAVVPDASTSTGGESDGHADDDTH